jgi:hypothetical protein
MESRHVMGMVTEVDLQEGHVRLREDDESFCTLCCGTGTHVLGGEQEPLGLAGLQPGDYVRSDCTTSGDGRLSASRIVLLRPAWRMLESPEM